MKNQEEQYLHEMIQQEHVRNYLLQQLSEIIDVKSLKYEISFIPTEYYAINEELMAAPYEPTYEYLIEGNADSKELVIPPHVLKVTSILRPTKVAVRKYLQLLDMLGVHKVFFQPFYGNFGNSSISLLSPQQNGGFIVRIGEVKEQDLMKVVK